jgi:hypothetical protein
MKRTDWNYKDTGMIDGAFLGNYVGADALAAVNL